jgi:hypothetical protein
MENYYLNKFDNNFKKIKENFDDETAKMPLRDSGFSFNDPWDYRSYVHNWPLDKSLFHKAGGRRGLFRLYLWTLNENRKDQRSEIKNRKSEIVNRFKHRHMEQQVG